MSNSIVEMQGYTLSKEIHAKKVSCVEVMDAYLNHIDKINPEVNAIVTLQDRDGLMAQAKEKDEQLAAGKDNGWMHGMPQAIKDLAATKGIRTTSGSPILKDFVPDDDILVVKQMKDAGSIIIGKTNTPEFGYGSQTYNPVFGATGNAYDPSKTSGGSSGGAGCSLALRMLPVADGSDYMGSLRNPAGWNNIYSCRPSVGTVPITGPNIFIDTMATLGPMGRTVADVALLLATQSGQTDVAPLSRADNPRIKELTPENVIDKLKKDVKGTKIAWMGDWGGHLAMEKGVLETCEKTLGDALPQIGASFEKVDPFYDPKVFWEEIWLPIRHYSACALAPFYNDPEKRKLLKPEAQFEFEGSVNMSAMDVYTAFLKRGMFYLEMLKVYENYDFIAVPSAQVFPFDKNINWPDEIEGRKMSTYHNWMEVVTHWTMGSNVIVTVPAGFGGADNLPMGIQLVAKPGCEFEILQFAKAYEEATGFVDQYRPALLD